MEENTEEKNAQNAETNDGTAEDTSGSDLSSSSDLPRVSTSSIKAAKAWLILLFIMIIISLGCASALLYLQITEYNFYLAEPSVWAGKGSSGASFTPQPLPSTITPISQQSTTSASSAVTSATAPLEQPSPLPSATPSLQTQSATPAALSNVVQPSSPADPTTSDKPEVPASADKSTASPITTSTPPQQSISTSEAPANVSDLLSILGNVGNK